MRRFARNTWHRTSCSSKSLIAGQPPDLRTGIGLPQREILRQLCFRLPQIWSYQGPPAIAVSLSAQDVAGSRTSGPTSWLRLTVALPRTSTSKGTLGKALHAAPTPGCLDAEGLKPHAKCPLFMGQEEDVRSGDGYFSSHRSGNPASRSGRACVMVHMLFALPFCFCLPLSLSSPRLLGRPTPLPGDPPDLYGCKLPCCKQAIAVPLQDERY